MKIRFISSREAENMYISCITSWDIQAVNLRGLLQERGCVLFFDSQRTKSDSDVILCLQLLSKTLMCTLHLS